MKFHELKNLNDTKNIAIGIASKCEPNDVFLFQGDIGSGKTTFCQFFIQHFLPNENISSPTFNIIHSYGINGCNINHLDLYRIKSQQELIDLGLNEILHNNITLVEWSENLFGYYIHNPIYLIFTHHKDNRNLNIVFSTKEQENRFIKNENI